MRRLRELIVYTYIILRSLYRTFFRWNLGEQVYIKGSKGRWVLYQGVDHPYWKASQLVNSVHLSKLVHEKELQKIWELSNTEEVFNSNRNFFMNNWYNIWTGGDK